MDEELTGIL